MLQQWLGRRPTNAADRLRDALRATGRHDVIAQCMTVSQQVRDRQEAINALVQRTWITRHTQHSLLLTW